MRIVKVVWLYNWLYIRAERIYHSGSCRLPSSIGLWMYERSAHDLTVPAKANADRYLSCKPTQRAGAKCGAQACRRGRDRAVYSKFIMGGNREELIELADA